MHWYKRNIGDYAKRAGRLSMLQHGAYTQLIDACYDREQFPTEEQAIEWLWASTPDEVAAVRFVLAKFFTLDSEGQYVNADILADILGYQQTSDQNRRIAIERELKRKESTKRATGSTERARSVNESPREQHEAPPNQEPRTKNHQPKEDAPRKRVTPPDSFDLPDWVNRVHWDTWHSSPKRKKATDDQKRLSLAKLQRWRDEGKDYAGALENAAVGGWQGLFLPEAKTTFAQQAADIARVTVPPRQEIDPVLAELTAHKGSAPPPEVREKMQRLLRGQA